MDIMGKLLASTPAGLPNIGDFLPFAISDDGDTIVGTDAFLGSPIGRWVNGVGYVSLGFDFVPPIVTNVIQTRWTTPDCTSIVGTDGANATALIWTSGGGLATITPPAPEAIATAQAISKDGTTVVGEANNAKAFKWTSGGGTVDLGWPGPGTGAIMAMSVSQDGSKIAGFTDKQAKFWDTGVTTNIPKLGGGIYNSAYIISDDGITVVGVGDLLLHAGADQPWKWTSGGGTVNLGYTPINDSRPYGISSDGSIIVGNDLVNTLAWVYKSGAISNLDLLPGGTLSFVAAVSYDGTRACGYADTSLGDYHAVLWDIASLAATDLGVVTGQFNSQALAISTDGTKITGDSFGFPAWRTVVP